jgi:hypothetical protein
LNKIKLQANYIKTNNTDLQATNQEFINGQSSGELSGVPTSFEVPDISSVIDKAIASVTQAIDQVKTASSGIESSVNGAISNVQSSASKALTQAGESMDSVQKTIKTGTNLVNNSIIEYYPKERREYVEKMVLLSQDTLTAIYSVFYIIPGFILVFGVCSIVIGISPLHCCMKM